MSERGVTVRLVDGSAVDLDDVTGWKINGSFLQLATGTDAVCLFKANEVRSVIPRPPAPEDSALIPVASLPWRLKAWCVVEPDGTIRSRHDAREDAQIRAYVGERVVREETATLTRLVPIQPKEPSGV